MPTKEELKRQMEGDLKVIAALKVAGSNISKPHRIEHHFNTLTREDAEAIRAWGVENGFSASEVNSNKHKGTTYFFLDLIKDSIPEIRHILPDTSRLFDLAKEHNGEYDGWGCYIVK